MIIKRLADGFRIQDWFTVVVEVLIVVVGILIGLQIDDWNQARIDREEEAYYLERMAHDLELSIARAEGSIGYLEKLSLDTSVILNSLLTCQLAESDENTFANGLHRLAKFNPPSLYTNTYTEMKDTGSLSLLTNDGLREAISLAFETNETAKAVFAQILTRTMPHVSYVETRFILYDRGARRGGLTISSDDISYEFNTMCEDRIFVGAVSSLLDYNNYWLAQSQRQLARYQELATKIALSRGAN
jgi:Family of unknown function (DUF6090)